MDKVEELSIKWFYVQILTVIVLPFPPYAPKPLLAFKHTQVWEWVDTFVLKKTFQIVSFLTSSSASTLYMCSASNQRSGWRRFFMGWSSSVCLFAWLNKGSVKGLLKVRHSPRPESLIFLTFKDAAIFHPFILNEGRHLTIDSLSNSLSYTIQEYYALR